MKKLLICLSLVLFASLLACSNDTTANPNIGDLTNDDGTVSIEFYGWGSAEEEAVFQSLVNEFMEINPNIIVTYTCSAADTYMRVLQNRVNNLPDVFYMPDTEFMLWADSGRLMNLQNFVDTEEVNSLWPEAINHYLYDRETQTLGTGSLYALPKDLGPFTLVYNKTLFDEITNAKGLSLDYPSQDTPMTWANFIDLLVDLKYTKNSQEIFGITHYELASAVYSNNADFFGDSIQEEGISDPNFIQALQFIADLYLQYDVMPSPDEQNSMNGYQRFLNGGAVFFFMGPWDSKGFWQDLSFEYELLPVPVGPAEGAKSTTWVGSMGLAISSQTQKANAAYKLIQFLSMSEQAQRISYTSGQSIPNLMNLADDYVNEVGMTENNHYLPYNKQVFIDIVENSDTISGKARAAYYTYDSIWYTDLQDELIDVFLGNETAAEFSARYSQVLEQALEDSYSYVN